MEISQSQQGPITILGVSGPIISGEFSPLEARVFECISSNALKIVIEIQQVPFIDGEGLNKILEIVLDVGKRGGYARIASPNDVCNDIFTATRVREMIEVFDDVDAAVKSLL